MNQINCEPADIKIYLRGKGIVVNEKSAIALRAEGNKLQILAVGTEALTGNFPQDTVVNNPFHQGAVDDFTVASQIMKTLMHRAMKQSVIGWRMRKPSVLACVTQGLSLVDLKAYEDMYYYAGARKVDMRAQTLQEFLTTASEEEKKKYELVISVEKDNPLEYVRERVKETVAYAQAMGIAKESLIDMISES